MNTRRKLTAKEQDTLITRLENMKSSIEESYEYPLEDMIENLRDPKQRKRNEIEEKNGKADKYYIHFTSPSWTWEMLCGRSGVYTIDATSLKALNFELGLMN